MSVGQPAWQRDGSLRFVSDRHGWWQPHRHSGWPDGPPRRVLTTAAAEFHGPDWALGQSTMAELADGGLVARMTSEGRDCAGARIAGGPTGRRRRCANPCVSIAGLCAHGDGIAYIGAPPDGPANVWTLGPLTGRGAGAAGVPGCRGCGRGHSPGCGRVRPSPPTTLARGDVSVGEAFSLVGPIGRRVHGLVYRTRR